MPRFRGDTGDRTFEEAEVEAIARLEMSRWIHRYCALAGTRRAAQEALSIIVRSYGALQ
jgi:hypothetical protein